MSTPSSSDWRSQLQLHEREKVVSKIVETIKNNVKVSDANNAKELLRIAVQFEGEICAAASSMDDYLRKISEMIYLDTMSQPPAQTNPELTTSASSPSTQINPNLPFSASNILGLPKLGFMNQNHRLTGSPVLHLNINNSLQACLPASESTSTYASNLQNIPRLLQSSINNSWRPQQQSQNSLKNNQMIHSQMLNEKLHHSSLSHSLMQQQQQSTQPFMSSHLHASPSSPYHSLNPNHQLHFGSSMLYPRLPHQQTMPLQNNAPQGQCLGSNEQLNISQKLQQRHPLPCNQSAINGQLLNQKDDTSVNSRTLSGNIGATDWQEDGYQKLQSMKEQYLTELNEVREKTKLKQQQLESLVPSIDHAQQLHVLENIMISLTKAIAFVTLPKSKVTATIVKIIPTYKEDISKFVGRYKQRKVAQANQPQEGKLEATGTSSKHQNISTCSANTLPSGVGPVQASSSVSQLDSTARLNNLTIKCGSSTVPRLYECSAGQRQNYYHQLVKDVAPCQNIPFSLPQNCHNSPSSNKESASSPLVDNDKRKSTSPLIAERVSHDGNQGAAETSETSVQEQPMHRLIRLVRSLDPESLRSAAGSIKSIVAMNDMIPISRHGYGHQYGMVEDIAESTNYCPQSKKMKRDIAAIPRHVSSVASVNDNLNQMHGFISSEVNSTETSSVKGINLEINHALIEEIREINQKQMDLTLEVSEVDSEHTSGIVIKCSYSAVALSPDLKARICSSQMPPILPMKLQVPPGYPKCSACPMTILSVEPNAELEFICKKARSRFYKSVCFLPEPITVKVMANEWGASAREAVLEYAEGLDGGTFSSVHGSWEYCVGA